MDTLLDLFEKTDVASEGLLSPVDILYCEDQERGYLEWVSDLKQAIALVPACEQVAGASETLVGELRLLSAKLEKQLKEVQVEFVKRIVTYLNTEYRVSLNADLAKDASTWREVVAKVATGSNTTFFNQGLSMAIKNFHNYLYPNKATLKGNVITLPKYRLRDYDWDVISYWNKGFQYLLSLICWHDTGSLKFDQGVAEPFLKHASASIGELIEINFPKLKAFRVYKNHRLDLIFQSNKYAYDFFQKTKLADAAASK